MKCREWCHWGNSLWEKRSLGPLAGLLKFRGTFHQGGWRLRPSYCKAVPILAAGPGDLGRYILGGETWSLRITQLPSVPPIIINSTLLHFSHLGFVTPCTWRPQCYPHLIAGQTEVKGTEADLLSPGAGRQWILNVDLQLLSRHTQGLLGTPPSFWGSFEASSVTVTEWWELSDCGESLGRRSWKRGHGSLGVGSWARLCEARDH